MASALYPAGLNSEEASFHPGLLILLHTYRICSRKLLSHPIKLCLPQRHLLKHIHCSNMFSWDGGSSPSEAACKDSLVPRLLESALPWPLVIKLTDINTDPSCRRITDQDMAPSAAARAHISLWPWVAVQATQYGPQYCSMHNSQKLETT